jgi:hypothetical protein
MAAKLLPLCAGLYSQEYFWYSFLLEAESTLEGLGQLKNPMTSPTIEPTMFLVKSLLCVKTEIERTEKYHDRSHVEFYNYSDSREAIKWLGYVFGLKRKTERSKRTGF